MIPKHPLSLSLRGTLLAWLVLLLLAVSPSARPESGIPGFGRIPGGLVYTWYHGQWSRLPDLAQESPAGFGIAEGFGLDLIPETQDYAVRFEGYIEIPVAGEYRFYTTSDDGSALYIGDLPVVNNDGLHGKRTRWGSIALAAGTHAIRVEYFQRGGGQVLAVGYQPPGGVAAAIPLADLSYDPSRLPVPREPDLPTGAFLAGLAYEYHEGDWQQLPDFAALDPMAEGAAAGFDLGERLRDNQFGFRFQGYLVVPEDGLYTFYTESDDGSALYIGDRRVVNNDGAHSLRERSGAMPLKAGVHRITVAYFERWGDQTLRVRWAGPSFAKTVIPPEALFHTPDMLPPLKTPDTPASPPLPGAAYRYYEGDWTVLPDFAALQPKVLGVSEGFDLGQAAGANRFGFRFTGYLRVPSDGVYRFYTTSDDGSRLWIGDTLVVDNDGAHSARRAFGGIALAAGVHAFRLDYFQRGGSKQLSVEYRTPDGLVQTLPPEAVFHTAEQLPPLAEPVPAPAELRAGLAYGYFEGDFRSVADVQAATALSHGVADRFGPAPRARDNQFGLVFDGYIEVPEDGHYRFSVDSDDGSRLWIGDTLVVDNDGPQSAKTVSGSIGLKAGLHPIRVAYFERWGNETLRVAYRTPGGAEGEIPAGRLFHSAAQLPALEAAVAPPATARPGLAYRYYEGNWSALPDFAALAPAGLGVVANVGLATAAAPDKYGFDFEGFIRAPADGFYDFYTLSDDGSRLWIDGRLVVDNDGLHSARERSGNIGLAAGWHRIRVAFFERGGDDLLAVSWRVPGGERAPVPDAALAFDPAVLPELARPDAAREALVGGLEYAYYEWAKGQANWKALPNLAAMVPAATGTVEGFSLAPRRRDDKYAFRFKGYIDIPEYGYYSFYTSSDDGSRLYLDGQLVVDNDGLHGARERSGRIGLERGRHAITVDFFEWTGEDLLSVAYAGPHFDKLAVTPEVLFRLDPARNGDPGDPGEPEGPTPPGANQPPAPAPDLAQTGIGAGQGVAVDVLANDADPDGDIPLLLGIDPASGRGAALIDPAGRKLIYYPPLGFVGEDRLAYTLGDRRGGTATGQLVVRVGADAGPLRMSAPEAARFLAQASFGPTKAGIAELMRKGAEAWIDEQLALPPTLHAEALNAMRRAGENPSLRELRVRAWLDRAVNAPDQLRQRVAFALSEILVVSDLGNALGTDEGAPGAADYYDLLVNGAFGGYRPLLDGVTLHPAMGLFLNMAGSQKADPVLGTVPDENYAREIMQLFSLGLWQLAPDGRRVTGADGQPVPAYTQEDVMELAKVFTGWDFAAPSGTDRYRLPLALDPAEHEDGPKTLAGGLAIPAGLGGEADLARALDHLAAHPNLPPFIARQLIQRLVASNPSPAYVGRVAAAFRASGLNLGAAVKAILLDPEARTAPADAAAADGKIREPLLQLTALWRGLGVDSTAIRLRLDQLAPLGQTPLSAPSVFNFFKPDYQSPGEIADLGLYSPELEAINEKQVLASANLIDDWTLGGADYYDLAMELAYAGSPADRALDHLGLLFQAGRMSEAMRRVLADALFDGTGLGGAYDERERLTRMLGAVYLILTSPEFQTQR